MLCIEILIQLSTHHSLYSQNQMMDKLCLIRKNKKRKIIAFLMRNYSKLLLFYAEIRNKWCVVEF